MESTGWEKVPSSGTDSLFLAQESLLSLPGTFAQDLIKRLLQPGRNEVLRYWDRSQHIHFTGTACRVSNGNGPGLPYPGASSLGFGEHLASEVTAEERLR